MEHSLIAVHSEVNHANPGRGMIKPAPTRTLLDNKYIYFNIWISKIRVIYTTE